MKNPPDEIECRISSHPVIQQRVERNQSMLCSIIKCLELCEQQSIALLGDRDDGTYDLEQRGKMKADIYFGINSDDEFLRDYLQLCRKNAMYISNTYQNYFLECMGEPLENQFWMRLETACTVAVLANEVIEVSGWDQLGHSQK